MSASLPDLAEIHQTASVIIDQQPHSPVRRLLREIVGEASSPGAAPVEEPDLHNSRQVLILAGEQHPDGSWGAFHSENTQRKQKIPTTEFGVRRARALGVSRQHPVLRRAEAYLLQVVSGARPFPDRPEKNDRWETGKRLFLLSTLALIAPAHPLAAAERALWIELTHRSFERGRYDPQAETRAHAALTGASVTASYLAAGSRYQLELLGSQRGCLPVEVEYSLLSYLWQRPQGIGYLSAPLQPLPPSSRPEALDRWLASLEILSKGFPAWVTIAEKAIAWLWSQRKADGLWDFGSKPSRSMCLPLSDDWHSRENRRFDWTARCLALFVRYLHDHGG